ncbi:Ti-type conjugative transfer relaxase TraA [Agrobacterium rosae]|uniref:Ti-type conjugative transfer relaxase TraA n=1 Tax=Agrobacterium rosae TaxID=1972867 RepID=UPI00122F051E|nr:Ti-type conjugative transfer relaxase TraA [Agrobacterium rosae]KAA3506460.1 Ti-type conjugative transfer relaxase TraA [Agrobacterium rosae]KAA3511407.1 Ti-type conjugative transfer relaxase TraA [Agrobacterium rosae]MQB51374.1 Ti-type conjugative transfer relaxase TraA [Agrobacterium rosae]
MAIYHLSSKSVSRSGGRSAVAAIAYRTASLLVNERDGIIHDFTAKQGVDHCEIVLPDGIDADWARDRSALWNGAEAAEKRCDARVAREFEIALPHELNNNDRLSLTRAFAQDLANRYGTAVDFAIHVPQGKSDIRNIHAHVMMTTRVVTPTGLGDKSLIERENKWLLDRDLPTSHLQMRDIRQMFEQHANRHMMRAGLDVRIDHRSHLERGLEIEPTEHMGVHASQMQRRGLDVERSRIEEQAAKRNAVIIRRKPDDVLRLLTDEKSVFTRHDVARMLHRYINDTDAFQRAFATVMASSQLVELQAEQHDELARYSTREMIGIEHAMAASALRMADRDSHGVRPENVDHALDRQDAMLPGSGLSDEQRTAVRHITAPQQIAAVIGFAGAGKSTMLAAARDAWERQGFTVHGAALAGKAAEGLTQSSGIAARTLASWEYGWQNGKGELQRGDILVIDEAGMVGSRQLARIVAHVEARGAKLVLVGDHEQLQAIGAGSPFRAIAERIGSVELTEIRRQKQDWQRQASIAFATHRTGDGLAAYAEQGSVQFADNRDQAREQLVTDYLADLNQNPSASRIALAHRRVDVRAINDGIREALQAEGRLAKGSALGSGNDEASIVKVGTDLALKSDREIVYQTVNGKRSFAPGDRILLLENNRDLGVKNGMLGRVEAVEPNAIHLRLDGSSAGQNNARVLSLPVKDYQSFDHGYATTIHKAQGATVDVAFVMASSTMDRHLTYVAMTRHRDQATLYAGRDELKNITALSDSMSRSGAKETTLDYIKLFAERRGLASKLNETDAIKLELQKAIAHDVQHPAGQPVGQEQDRPHDRGQAYEEPVHDLAGPAHKRQLSSGLTHPSTTNDEPFVAYGERPAPLIPAVTQYAKTIEDIAREKALAHLTRDMEAVRSLGRDVYLDPDHAVASLTSAITEKGIKGQVLAKSLVETPEQFGALRGKAGLFGDNRERKLARQLTNALSSHVLSATKTWQRRLEAERRSETWKRERQDIVEVPGLTRGSEALLQQLASLTHADRPALLKQLLTTPEGAQALTEAKTLASALEQRFGSIDMQQLKPDQLRLGQDIDNKLDQIKQVARIVERAHRAELTHQQELKQSLTKSLGLRM